MKNIIILSLIFLIIFSCKDINKFSAGSYPFAEVFEITLPKENVINRINSLKLDEELQVPPFVWAGKETQLKDKILYNGYFIFYIFIKESNQIMYLYVREENSNKSRIGLISVQNGLSLGNWKDVNKDLSEEENKKLKELFKERIISKIK